MPGVKGRSGVYERTAETKAKMSASAKARTANRKGGHKKQVGCYCWQCFHRSGSEHQNWKGGAFAWRTAGWKAARERIWARDKICRVCGGLPTSGKRLSVHHVIARRDGGTHEDDNLVGVHQSCHVKLHYGTVELVA